MWRRLIHTNEIQSGCRVRIVHNEGNFTEFRVIKRIIIFCLLKDLQNNSITVKNMDRLVDNGYEIFVKLS